MGKRGLYALFLTTVVLLLVEAAVRAFFYTQVGSRVLWYGTEYYRNIVGEEKKAARENWRTKHYTEGDRTVELHGNQQGAYAKFFPNEKKVDKDIDTGEVFEVTINSRGFRGEEFSNDKGNRIRVLTLGASSTFGYYNKDQTTYPYFMEEMLNGACPGEREFEVINFGIPHLTSSQVLALYLSEGIELDPDFITLYSGSNDAFIWDATDNLQGVERLYVGLINRLLTLKYLDHLLKVEEKLLARSYSDEYAAHRSNVFLSNVQSLYDESTKHDTRLIVATQQKKSESIARQDLRGVSYQREASAVRGRYDAGERLEMHEISFLIHHRIMGDLREWAQQGERPLVDVISLLDGSRDYLLSNVHLHSEANRQIAAAFAYKILEQVCTNGIPARLEDLVALSRQ